MVAQRTPTATTVASLDTGPANVPKRDAAAEVAVEEAVADEVVAEADEAAEDVVDDHNCLLPRMARARSKRLSQERSCSGA